MENGKDTIEPGWKLDNSYSCLPESFFSRVGSSPVSAPKLVISNSRLCESLGLNSEFLQSEEGIWILAGNSVPENSVPIAQAYAGHQFGYFTMLGDGRAVLIGEQITPSGDRYDIQLKGSGRTPYSRGGDGRAALGPMLREYIISEAMHALGIPTTRSLAVVTTGETVLRDAPQPGAVLTRVASSHLRVGTFQYAALSGSVEKLRILADYTIKRHYPEAEHDGNRYVSLLKEVIKSQASLIAKWQLVGFIHGVMNTDNVALSGETIDYGPCAFMNEYDPATVFSSIDRGGRYAYGNQPSIAEWNLARFAETLLPLLSDYQEEAVETAQDALVSFSELYSSNWLDGVRAKLGLFNEEDGDASLIDNLLNMMHKHHADFTNTFIALTFNRQEDTPLFQSGEFNEWHKLWQARLSRQVETKQSSNELMRNSNPALIPRNHRVEEALEAAAGGDYSFMHRLLNALASPYEHTPLQAEYFKPPGPSACGYKTFCGT
jgi:uncharacterized protein YdiU (UPF0061 family)